MDLRGDQKAVLKNLSKIILTCGIECPSFEPEIRECCVGTLNGQDAILRMMYWFCEHPSKNLLLTIKNSLVHFKTNKDYNPSSISDDRYGVFEIFTKFFPYKMMYSITR